MSGGVAFVTFGFLVFVSQWKLGVFVVIEPLGRFPISRIVTFVAFLTQRAIVLVVFSMT